MIGFIASPVAIGDVNIGDSVVLNVLHTHTYTLTYIGSAIFSSSAYFANDKT